MFLKIQKLFASYTAKDLYFVSTGNLIIILTGFLFTVLAARNLMPETFGIFSALISLTLIFSDLGDLGIGAGLSNFLPPLIQLKDRLSVNKVIKTTLILQLFISLIILLVFFAFSKEIALLILRSDSANSLNFIRLSALGVVSFMLYNFFNSVLSAKEQFKKTFMVMLFYSVPRLLILILTLLFLNLDVAKIFLIFTAGPLIGFIIGALFSNLDFIKAKGLYPIKKILSFSVFLSINKIFVSLFSRLDVIMLSSLASSYSAGIYSAASRVAFIYPLVGGSLATVLAPRYARFSTPEALKYSKKVFLLIIALITSVFLLMLLSPFVIDLVYGSSYNDSARVLRFLLLSIIPFLLAIPTNNLLTYTLKKPQLLAVSSLIQLVIIFSLNLLLVPRLGSIGPAISIGLSATVALFISFLGTLFFLKHP